jgi:hypothetical protein
MVWRQYYAILKGTAATSKFIWCLYNFQPPFTCPNGTGRPIKGGKHTGAFNPGPMPEGGYIFLFNVKNYDKQEYGNYV